jgi:hypothetical protein
MYRMYDKFLLPAKLAFPPSMAVVWRGACDFMDAGGRATQGAKAEMAKAAPRHPAFHGISASCTSAVLFRIRGFDSLLIMDAAFIALCA